MKEMKMYAAKRGAPLRGKPENSIKRGWEYLCAISPGALVLQTSRNEFLSACYFLFGNAGCFSLWGPFGIYPPKLIIGRRSVS